MSEMRGGGGGRGGIQFAMVDAFTNERFKGNPAAVCLVPPGATPVWMQLVASEFNVSQTAFLVENKAGDHTAFDYELRWFSPTVEVPLCGHGTLASAYYLFLTHLVKGSLIRFKTESGVLYARKIEADDTVSFQVELDFPLMSVASFDEFNLSALAETLQSRSVDRHQVLAVSKTGRGDVIVELSSRELVEKLQPSLREMSDCSDHGVIFTAKGNDHPSSGIDFVSRFFCPNRGVDEDPVCGSAHCALAPYWAKKLRRDRLTAYQVSKRGGKLGLNVDWERNRVLIRGEAVVTMSGFLL